MKPINNIKLNVNITNNLNFQKQENSVKTVWANFQQIRIESTMKIIKFAKFVIID